MNKPETTPLTYFHHLRDGTPTILPGVIVTVPGTAVGDSISATFAGTPPTGVLITGAQVMAPNTVLVGFQALQAVTLAAGTQNLNFVWTR